MAALLIESITFKKGAVWASPVATINLGLATSILILFGLTRSDHNQFTSTFVSFNKSQMGKDKLFWLV